MWAERAAGPLGVEDVGEVLLVRDTEDFRKGINGRAVPVEAALGGIHSARCNSRSPGGAETR